MLDLEARRQCGPIGRRMRWPARRMICGARPCTPIASQVCDGLGRASNRTPATTSHHATERRGCTALALPPHRESPSTASPSVRTHDAIEIAADPRSAVPPRARLAVHELRLELIEQHLEVDRAIVHRVAAVIGTRPRGRHRCIAARSAGSWRGNADWPCMAGRAQCACHSLDPHFPEHARFHVKEQVAVIRPPPERVGRHAIGAPRARRHVDGVLADHEIAGVVLEIAPHAVQVDRVRHHRVVDEDDAHALAVVQSQRRRRRRT